MAEGNFYKTFPTSSVEQPQSSNAANAPAQLARMQIFIKALTGKTTTLDVELADTIGSLKQQLSEKEGIPLWTIRLFYNGRGLLEDDQSVEYYRIHRGKGMVHLILRFTVCSLGVPGVCVYVCATGARR